MDSVVELAEIRTKLIDAIVLKFSYDAMVDLAEGLGALPRNKIEALRVNRIRFRPKYVNRMVSIVSEELVNSCFGELMELTRNDRQELD